MILVILANKRGVLSGKESSQPNTRACRLISSAVAGLASLKRRIHGIPDVELCTSRTDVDRERASIGALA